MTAQQHTAAAAGGEVLALIPAAGHARRMEPLPCSKEIYPIGASFADAPAMRPKAACQFLIENMSRAGVRRGYIVLRDGKWDIPKYLLDGKGFGMDLAYLVVGETAGPPYTLDRAYPFVRRSIVAFGFPDILFAGDDAFSMLLRAQSRRGADVVLGLFPADRPEKMDMVDVGPDGWVTDLVIQPRTTRLQHSWDAAVWKPTFTEFMHDYLAPFAAAGASAPELSVGHVIQAAIGAGLKVEGVQVSDEPYYDIGTPEGLARALRRFAPLD